MENPIIALRKNIQSLLMGTNNIDKLMSDKVDAYVLLEEQPVPFQVGKYTVFVGNLTIENNYKFWELYGRVLAHIGLKHVNFDMLSDGAELYKALMLHKKLYKDLCKLIHKTICKQQAYYLDQITKERKLMKWKSIPLRYFIKNVSIEKLVQMCFMVYLYNFDAEKKNLQVINFQLPRAGKATMETYMSFYYQNMPGIMGRFVEPLLTKPTVSCDDETTDAEDDEAFLEKIGEQRKNKTVDTIDP